MAVRDNPSALRSHHADDDADAIFVAGQGVDSFGEHFANIRVRRENDGTRALPRLRSAKGCHYERKKTSTHNTSGYLHNHCVQRPIYVRSVIVLRRDMEVYEAADARVQSESCKILAFNLTSAMPPINC